ncbi:MAG: rod shape-determining protein RodA [Candidatus Omnitrophica bacterium]|nr:rod shape-determining protein RodA [Candidatus Omnitrophota bacterium]
MFDRRLLINFDYILFIAIILLCAVGIANLYSIGQSEGIVSSSFYYRQIMWLCIGICGMLLVINIPYTQIIRYAYYIHGFFILLIILVLFLGSIRLGSQRWISLGGFSFQPSEFAKISFILCLSKFFSENIYQKIFGLRDLVFPLFLLSASFTPIFLQPDLGTAGIFCFVFLFFLFFITIKKKTVLPFFGAGLSVLPFFWSFLKDYQKKRILVFLDPYQDPLRAGYQIIQSKIAVGSGGIFGKGFCKGTQSQLRFLPEQHSDFVFSVWAEEWGFVGCCIVLFLFFLIIYRGLSSAFASKNISGSFLALGITGLFFIQFFINICMTIGIFPVVGVPLPFMSYGGSALVSYMMGVGLILNVGMRRFK